MKQLFIHKAIVITMQNKGHDVFITNQSNISTSVCQCYKASSFLKDIMTQPLHWNTKSENIKENWNIK